MSAHAAIGGARPRPATVLSVQDHAVRVGDAEHQHDATIAIPWRLHEGDQVLIVGDPDDAYVIGILGSRAPVVLATRELHLEAEHLRLNGTASLDVAAPEVTLRADRLRQVARMVHERIGNLFRRVDGLLQLRAGRTRTFVDGAAVHKSARYVQRAEHDVKLDGARIRLG